MGNNLGTPEHKKKYTDYEIKQNMKVLFDNNKHNPVETSYSLGGNLEVTTEKKASVGGYKKIKFESSRNRHLKHNIDSFLQQQNGGGRKKQNEDVLNNFNMIKEYLMNDLDSNLEEQYGGNDSDTGSFSFSSELSDSSNDTKNNFSVFKAMMGGNGNVDTSSLGTTTKLSDSDSDDSSTSSSSSSSGSTESDNTLESSDLDTTTTETNNSSTISKTSPVSETLPSEKDLTTTSYTTTTKSTTMRANEPFIVQSTESSIDTSITMNEYNGGSESSELNIVPFYSSETSNKHPYVSRRFK
jgi:hypothetical protein